MIWAEIFTGLAGFGIANYGLYRLGMWSARNDLKKTIIELEKQNKEENSRLLRSVKNI